MKRFLLSSAIALVFSFVSVAAFAAIDNTHHSLKAYNNNTGTSQFTCFACHGYPAPAMGNQGLGTVGSMCYNRCHIGAGGIAGSTAAIGPGVVGVMGTVSPNENVVLTYTSASSGLNAIQYGHGMNWGAFPVKDNTATLPAWPYVADTYKGDTTKYMQCTSCHDVHNNAFAPFLRAALSLGATTNEHAVIGTGVITDPRDSGFCTRCHQGGTSGAGRFNVITAAANGTHPIELDNTGASWAGTRSGSGRAARTIALKGGNVFMQATSWGTALNGAQGTTWNLGGKLGGNPQRWVGCYTCHAVHMDVINNTSGSARNVQPNGQTFKNLTAMAYTEPTAHTATNDDLCVGCHGATGSLANPGATAYYHPVGSETDNTVLNIGTAASSYTVSTGAFDIVVDMSGKVYGGDGSVATGRLMCTSCHAPAHGGYAGTLIYQTYAHTQVNTVWSNCAACHNTNNMGTAPDSHHVYGTTTNYLTATPAWGNPTAGSNPTYMTGTIASLQDGLQCHDCHTSQSQTAHNWQ